LPPGGLRVYTTLTQEKLLLDDEKCC
jgi:hypothetical protein